MAEQPRAKSPVQLTDQDQEGTLLAGILLLVWLPSTPVLAGLRRLAVVLASASLYAYLVHWLVYPPLVEISPALAVAASLAAGVAYWVLWMRVMNTASRWCGGCLLSKTTRQPSPRQAASPSRG